MRINRILLLDPPFFRFFKENQRGIPLGLAYLAAYLKEHSYMNVTIYNADFDPGKDLKTCNRDYFGEMDHFEEYLTNVTSETTL